MKHLSTVLLLCFGSFASGQTGRPTVVDPSSPAILYSPFTWNVLPGAASTIDAGAYLKTMFGGTSISVMTDTTDNTSPYSQLWMRVDGQAWVQYRLTYSNPTFNVASGLPNRVHLLELIVKSTSETIPRWKNSATMVTITGFVLDPQETLSLPQRRSKNVLIFGDSITEGVRTVSCSAATDDTDRNDVLGDYSYAISTAFDAEVGIVAFGGMGITVNGSGGVPSLPSSYNYLYSGVQRRFNSPAPDLVIYNEGTNDSGDIKPMLQQVIEEIIELAPDSKHLVLVPFNAGHQADISAVVAAIGSANVTASPTAGFFDPATSCDGLHPYSYSHLGLIAPRLFPLIRAALDSNTPGKGPVRVDQIH